MKHATVTTVLEAPRGSGLRVDVGHRAAAGVGDGVRARVAPRGRRLQGGQRSGRVLFLDRGGRAQGDRHVCGPTKDAMAVFPTRVVALPDGHSAYSFTMFQAPGHARRAVRRAARVAPTRVHEHRASAERLVPERRPRSGAPEGGQCGAAVAVRVVERGADDGEDGEQRERGRRDLHVGLGDRYGVPPGAVGGQGGFGPEGVHR